MITPLQKRLDAKASIALEYLGRGWITKQECDRAQIDKKTGIDTGDLQLLPQREWTRARMAAQAMRQKKGGLG